jgi:hypothetical protein
MVKNAVPPLPHHVSHNIGLTPFTNLSSGRKDNWKVTYPVDGGSSLLYHTTSQETVIFPAITGRISNLTYVPQPLRYT